MNPKLNPSPTLNTRTPGKRGPHRRQALVHLLAAGLLTAGLASAQTSDAAFPSKPITIVVPFAPGGSLDGTARILAEHMRDTLGQPVLVSNRPGAGSSVGARAVATSPADGYTLFFASGSAYGFMHQLIRGFDHQLSDFVPIAGVANNTSLFAVNAAVPANTLQELVALSRSRPNGIDFCTTGVNGLNHLQLEMLKSQAKAGGNTLNATHVPYNGVAPALTALRAGDVQACALPYSALVKNLHGSEIRVLAVQRGQRLAALPDVPAAGEAGFPGLDGNDALVNIAAPKGTSAEVVRKLEQAVRTAMQDPAVIRRLEEIDVQPVFVSARDTQARLEEDVRKFSAIIREAGLGIQQ